MEKLYQSLDMFEETFQIQMPQGSNVLDALKQVSGITVKKIGDREYVTSVNGEEGYYIYEVDGVMPNKSINKFKIKKDLKIKLKKLVPVKKKEIVIKVAGSAKKEKFEH
jgi:nitrogen regulatory protein PII-like uncharacterized protein